MPVAKTKLFKEVKTWAEDVSKGKIIANKDRILAAQRFLKDLDNPKYEIRCDVADFVIKIIEATFVHVKGDLKGQEVRLQPWQKFICYNLAGFYFKGTNERRFKEAFIFVPRKNGKTFFASALAWAFSLLERNQYSALYIVATKLSRAMEAFQNIQENIEYMNEDNAFRIRNNNFEHSVYRQFYDDNGDKSGAIEIQAIGSDAKRADGINCNIVILDEIHGYKNANEYYVYKQATKAYTNKLVIGITTAGENMNSFCYQRLQYCQDILAGTREDESYFVFICMADNPDDYTNPIEHEKANPNYGVTIKPKEILEESLQAQNDPSGRSIFLNKSLNIYTATTKSYFIAEEYMESDKAYNWSIEDLAQLPIEWYGGADLSKLHDLTGVALYGRYKGVDICITHAFIPITEARRKADEDNIPVFLWQELDWLTVCNSENINYDDVVKWFVEMREAGFKIQWVGYDRRYSREFVGSMKRAGFKMRDQSQRYVEKTEAFREIEKQIKARKFYYLHNKAFEYCISNVHAIEDSDEFIKYQKIQSNQRIDLFDAGVIACKQMLVAAEKKNKVGGWFG